MGFQRHRAETMYVLGVFLILGNHPRDGVIYWPYIHATERDETGRCFMIVSCIFHRSLDLRNLLPSSFNGLMILMD